MNVRISHALKLSVSFAWKLQVFQTNAMLGNIIIVSNYTVLSRCGLSQGTNLYCVTIEPISKTVYTIANCLVEISTCYVSILLGIASVLIHCLHFLEQYCHVAHKCWD